MSTVTANDKAVTKQRPNHALWLAMRTAVVTVITITSGCARMVEPPDFPGAIRNFLAEPVEIHEYSLEHPDTTTFVVQLGPGDVHELPPLGDRCDGAGLVALGSDGEVGKLEDLCAIASDEVWVLHTEGHYVTSYEGDDTYYIRD